LEQDSLQSTSRLVFIKKKKEKGKREKREGGDAFMKSTN
jgi:hypothetical protein